MGNEYQYSQSLSDLGKAREPSFSSYLNGADGEISVFSADKYFNEGIEDGQKAELNHRVGAKEGESKKSAVKGSKLSLGTSSTRSEYSWHSQSVLLRSFGAHVPGRHSSGEMPRKKSLLSSITCRCSCASKKSIKVDDRHLKRAASKEHIGAGMTRADQLVNASATLTLASKPWMKNNSIPYPLQKPSLLDTATANTVGFPSPESKKSDTNSSSLYTDSFDLPECSVSGCATPTTCPRVDWSIVAACAADFPVQSDCKELKPIYSIVDCISHPFSL